MMILANLIFAFAIIRLVVSLTNFVSNLYLIKSGNTISSPTISILIPVRNEEFNIGNLLNDLRKLNYKNYEIIIYDDCSTDKTLKIIEKHCRYNPRIRVLKGTNLPLGWLGKNHGCYQLSNFASGEYFLFLDADVRVGPKLIEHTLNTIKKYKVSLLSIFPMQILTNKGTATVTPLMNWILLSLLPLRLVYLSGWTSFSAANGQFMLFNAKAYRQLGPHYWVRTCRVEDIEICKYYKKKDQKVLTLLGDEGVSCRMYTNRQDSIIGFSKNIFTILGNPAVAVLFFLVTSFGSIFIFVSKGFYAFIIYIIIILTVKLLTSIMSKQEITTNLIYSIHQQLSLFTIIYTALKLTKDKAMKWKGRTII